MNTSAVSLSKLRENVALAYRGQSRSVDLLLTALLARGHVLIEDVPGVGKTTLARALGAAARSISGASSSRAISLPGDVLGICVFDAACGRSSSAPARSSRTSCSPTRSTAPRRKTQSALLEAMNEGAGHDRRPRRPLPQPFMVIATQNPVEFLGHVPAAGVADRPVPAAPDPGYPEADEEKMLLRRGRHRARARRDPRGARAPSRCSPSRRRPRKIALVRRAARLPARARARDARHRGAPAAGLDARRPGALPLRPGPRPFAGPRLRDARRRAGGGRGRAGRTASCPYRRMDSGRGGREREKVRKILSQVAVPL